MEQSVYLLRQRKNHNRRIEREWSLQRHGEITKRVPWETRVLVWGVQNEMSDPQKISPGDAPSHPPNPLLYNHAHTAPMCGIYIWCSSTLFSWLGLLFQNIIGVAGVVFNLSTIVCFGYDTPRLRYSYMLADDLLCSIHPSVVFNYIKRSFLLF